MRLPKLLTDDQLAEIRADVRDGIRGPIMLKWIALLLAEHDDGDAPEASANEAP